MNRRLLIALAVLVLTPLLSLAWLGTRIAADAEQAVLTRFEAVIQARLGEQTAAVSRLMGDKQRALLEATVDLPEDPDALRVVVRRSPVLTHVLVLDTEGRRVFPPGDGPVSTAEKAFVERTRGLWQGRALQPKSKETATPQTAIQQRQGILPQTAKGSGSNKISNVWQAVQQASKGAHGWHIWYWGGGLNLMFWRREPTGRLVAVEVDRIQLLADVVARLPSTQEGTADESTALLDSSGQTVYLWGDGVAQPNAPRTLHVLPAPLSAWRLAWTGAVPTPKSGVSMLLGLSAVGLLLMGLAIYFYRESTRAVRRATRRVTFVNQVSHELKTPLTNIRMYAELLEDELYEEDPKATRYLGVIITESQRLSRLIGNILTFASEQKKGLTLRRTPMVLDSVVTRVVEQFRPALTRCNVTVEWVLDAPDTVTLDKDAVDQILGNLLSNIEKYAPGGSVSVRTRQTEIASWLVVHDSGPGIKKRDAERVFEPFERLNNALNEGAAGTGIGLGLARDLARLHAGDLALINTQMGACFEVHLPHGDAV